MSGRLSGKVAIVTGAGKGIGGQSLHVDGGQILRP
jgi:hypothetical protein